jgi:hypothetical protein
MKDQTKSAIKLLEALAERAKELTCLYAIEEILKEPDADVDQICDRVIEAIPPGWQFPEICVARITLDGKECCSPNFRKTAWKLSADIMQREQVVGKVSVYYIREMPAADIGPFLKEEKKLIETIADRLGHYLAHEKMKLVFQEWKNAGREASENHIGDWQAVLDLIRQTDNALFLRISNRMLNHLCWSGIEAAEGLRRAHTRTDKGIGNQLGDDEEQLYQSRLLDFSTEFTEGIFRIAAGHLSAEEILSRIQMWIHEDKLGLLLQAVHRHLPISEISNALRRYFITTREETDSRYPLARNLKVFLIAQLLSNQLGYINLAKDYLRIEDLYRLLQKVIFLPESHGKLGGKGAALCLASHILKKKKEGALPGFAVKVPSTWYIPSDMMLHFIHYNSMDEIIEQKYKETERVRLEYPYIIDILKQSAFPPEMVKGLSMALDDLGEGPLVVRSSSLLEGRMGSAFVGKYKSVFLANQGMKKERLRDLMRAVSEVYASNFGPDPIEYRAERGLLDFSEQMGIMIQKVVGSRVGHYFLPAYSGVARSRNDFQWSEEIKSEDGIARIMPGLGSRAADQRSDEHAVLFVPGRPSLEANGSEKDAVRHAPKMIDVIDLEAGRLRTVELGRLLENFGDEYPHLEQIVSLYENGQFRPLGEATADFHKQRAVVTFDGLTTRSPFALRIRNLLRTLEESLGTPVEIEFASDGEHFYLLQCRPQNFSQESRPALIPREMPEERILFSADRFVSNGRIPNITHIVYVDPAAYEAIEEPLHLRAVGQAVSELNQLLPKRQFIVMGPGRSGGLDIKLGDIDKAAALIGLIEPQSGEGDALSFGIHFLQDLAESGIRYLPVLANDEGANLNQRFFERSRNVMPELLPKYAFLSEAVTVIDVSKATDGKVLQLLMNADLGKAVGYLADSEEESTYIEEKQREEGDPEYYWRWRYRMAEQVAARLNPGRFGVVGFYIFGSTKNGTAGPASDIDILIHFRGREAQREELELWLEGWSFCLDEVNYLQTGYHSGGLLDVHIVSDDDIANKTSFAVKIGAVTDAARPLEMMGAKEKEQPDSTTHKAHEEEGAD